MGDGTEAVTDELAAQHEASQAEVESRTVTAHDDFDLDIPQEEQTIELIPGAAYTIVPADDCSAKEWEAACDNLAATARAARSASARGTVLG